MKTIIYTRPDGGITVVRPRINTHTLVDGEIVAIPEAITEEQALQRALAKLPADAVNPQVVDESQIPADRTFRNAWKAGPGRVEHDMAKCRELHKERLRAMRAPKFEPIERQQRTALVNGQMETARACEAQLQALRDVTADPAIAASTTPEDLIAVVPEILK